MLLASIENALYDDSGMNAIDDLLLSFSERSYAIIKLHESEAAMLQSSLSTLGACLQSFYGTSPRYHECAGSNVSAWSRRVFMHYAREGSGSAKVEGTRWPQLLAEAAAGAAEADPLMVRIGRAVTKALALRTPELCEPLTMGQFDCFYYPSNDVSEEERRAQLASGEQEDAYDDECPCPSHYDPGVVTVVAETEGGLEAKLADGTWHRLYLRTDEVCVLAGKTLQTLTSGRLQACMHRVALTAASRASVVFEVHTDMAEPSAPANDAGSTAGGSIGIAIHRIGSRRHVGRVSQTSAAIMKTGGDLTRMTKRELLKCTLS